MLKKTFHILFILFFTQFYAQTEIKINLASALILTPNIGIEIQLSEKFGYQLDTSATFFDSFEGSPFQTTQIFNEIRYYPKLKEGKNQRSFFIGPHIGYGMFTLKIPKFITSIVDTELKEEGSYQSGRNAYYGITIGKKIPLKSKKFNLELFLGGGTSQSNYKYYNKCFRIHRRYSYFRRFIIRYYNYFRDFIRKWNYTRTRKVNIIWIWNCC